MYNLELQQNGSFYTLSLIFLLTQGYALQSLIKVKNRFPTRLARFDFSRAELHRDPSDLEARPTSTTPPSPISCPIASFCFCRQLLILGLCFCFLALDQGKKKDPCLLPLRLRNRGLLHLGIGRHRSQYRSKTNYLLQGY